MQSVIILTFDLNLNVIYSNTSVSVYQCAHFPALYGLESIIDLTTTLCRIGIDTTCLHTLWRNINIPDSIYNVCLRVFDYHYIAAVYNADARRVPWTIKLRDHSDSNVESMLDEIQMWVQPVDNINTLLKKLTSWKAWHMLASILLNSNLTSIYTSSIQLSDEFMLKIWNTRNQVVCKLTKLWAYKFNFVSNRPQWFIVGQTLPHCTIHKL